MKTVFVALMIAGLLVSSVNLIVKNMAAKQDAEMYQQTIAAKTQLLILADQEIEKQRKALDAAEYYIRVLEKRAR